MQVLSFKDARKLSSQAIRKKIRLEHYNNHTSGLAANKLGQACTYLDIEKVRCNISTTAQNDSALVAFDASTDDTALLLNGDTDYDFSSFGGITNPKSTGVTGDIKITIPVQTANDSTFIMLECIKRYESLS